MSDELGTSPVPISNSLRSRASPSRPDSHSRATSTARLASPIPSGQFRPSPPPAVAQIPTPNQLSHGSPDAPTPLPGADRGSSLPGPGQSALAAALQNTLSNSPPRFGTPPIRPLSPSSAAAAVPSVRGSVPQSHYGSFDPASTQGLANRDGLAPYEDAEVVKRHLVIPSGSPSRFDDSGDDARPARGTSNLREETHNGTTHGVGDDEFSSLQLQGGDVTRQVYKWTEDAEAQGRNLRRQSFHIPRPEPEDEVYDINSIKIPGGFRRNYLRRAAASPSPEGRGGPSNGDAHHGSGKLNQPPKMLTNNFIEFLSLYGHFAGEQLEEDDEDLGPDEYFTSSPDPGDEREHRAGDGRDEDEEDRDYGEESAMLTPGKRRRRRKDRGGSGTNTVSGAALLLLKSFVGTGVLFLPKAYLNGGMLFSNVVLLVVSALSYYCFVLLVKTRNKVNGSFGDIGGIVYGKSMRNIILFSIVLSQIGFASAYIVFTSENLQAFILAVSDCRTSIDIKYLILMQLIIFLPLSLIRDISKLGATALIADAFILVGLLYLYYYDLLTIVANHGPSDIVNFNPKDWTLFIGTAIFTFEGIGLIIPIQESMKRPHKFPPVLGGVMIIITVVFISMGALSYAAYGSHTRTVVILNLPQDDKFVNAVQFLYSLAILLSTPLQLFPAIRITENELFARSGKYNPYIKWQKNAFRFALVMVTAAIAWGGAGDLDKFVALVGSFACVPLVYVYPPLLHYRAVARSRFTRVTDLALCVFGLVVMVYTTALTVQSWAAGGPGKSPGYCDQGGAFYASPAA